MYVYIYKREEKANERALSSGHSRNPIKHTSGVTWEELEVARAVRKTEFTTGFAAASHFERYANHTNTHTHLHTLTYRHIQKQNLFPVYPIHLQPHSFYVLLHLIPAFGLVYYQGFVYLRT